METSEKYTEIFKALAAFQSVVPLIERTKRNLFTKSDYSDLEDLIKAIRKPMADNGLFFIQNATLENLQVLVVTRICHVSGEWIEFGPFTVPAKGMDAHSIGSATSYAKRYALGAALGVVSGIEDDDGNTAQQSGAKAGPKQEEKISAAWAKRICEVFENEPESLNQLLNICGVKRVEDIPQRQHKAVIQYIEAKKREKQ